MRTLIIMPTYNEQRALPRTLRALGEDCPEFDVLVVDDNSPDGTGEWASTFARSHTHVHVLHRQRKDGLGRAYIEGFEWALARGYERIVEMDADSSHRSIDLPALVHALDGADLVIGSRFVPGGAVENWPAHRLMLSRAANTYTRFALGIPVKDSTAGFRVFRAETLRAIDFKQVTSQGYCFQIDMTWRVYKNGGRIMEVPITFVERTHGQSKMSPQIVREALVKVTFWGTQRLWERIKRLFGKK